MLVTPAVYRKNNQNIRRGYSAWKQDGILHQQGSYCHPEMKEFIRIKATKPYLMRFSTRAEMQLNMVALIRISWLCWIFVEHNNDLSHVVEL